MPTHTTTRPLPGPKGLGRPRPADLYSTDEHHARSLLIGWLDCAVNNLDGRPESVFPLHTFLPEAVYDELQTRHACQECEDLDLPGRRECLAADLVWETETDEEFAALPGITARHVYETRLARAAFEAALDIERDLIRDALTSGHQATADALENIYPYSARTLNQAELAQRTITALDGILRRMNTGDPYPARSTADEILIWRANQLFNDFLIDAQIGGLAVNLDDSLLEDADYLFLFDAAFDGIENTDTAQQMGMTITGPARWFEQFRPEGQVAPEDT